ncbi:hypothetical protein GGE68_002055 [Rhizobium leguminosarum]|uniref:hypothetical protein n=1 Tax=Rhizobium leguminosarum TaxID=384 RepID=UPI00160AC02A|nr:hypothetical protein [Rhizobium leguminosarum]MBB5663865.1 hypothetical protein [Rhizobium leguminosarum]
MRFGFALISFSIGFYCSVGFCQVVQTPPAKTFEDLAKESDIKVFPADQKPDGFEPFSFSIEDGNLRFPQISSEAPRYPFAKPMEQLPNDDPRVDVYIKNLTEYLDQRSKIDDLLNKYNKSVISNKSVLSLSENKDFQPFAYIADRTAKWNGEIFWAPASKETDVNLRYGDEARAVFGPIPKFDVTTLGAVALPDGWKSETASLWVEVDGNRAELKRNPAKPGNPWEFEHRDFRGNIVKWTATIDKCDKPSLAGGVTPCGTASRVSRTVKGNVEWIALARKTKGAEVLTDDVYWSQENPSFALLGYIGFNRDTGELAFFDGTYSGQSFSWDSPIVQPGGSGYQDDEGRALATRTYDPTFRINCAACHDNKEPRIITPYIKQARVGYRSPDLAAAFSLRDLLPEMTRGARTPYRVVGTSYTAIHNRTLEAGRSVNDPNRNCTACHGLTNLNTSRFASDAVGRLGSLTDDDATENSFRTDWALRSGEGKIHPWMLPYPEGADISVDPLPSDLSDSDWEALKKVMEDPDSDPRSMRLYTKVPAPESIASDETRKADPFGPENFYVEVSDNRDGLSEPMQKEIRISWTYLNGLGAVPERDDVRFNVAVLEREMPQVDTPPQISDFPSIEETKAIGASLLEGGVYTDGRLLIFKDLSFVGHTKWTDPVDTKEPRKYQLIFPAATGKQYLIRVSAKRFSFDQSGEVFSNADHVFAVKAQ